jgi:hypothetical protein
MRETERDRWRNSQAQQRLVAGARQRSAAQSARSTVPPYSSLHAQSRNLKWKQRQATLQRTPPRKESGETAERAPPSPRNIQIQRRQAPRVTPIRLPLPVCVPPQWRKPICQGREVDVECAIESELRARVSCGEPGGIGMDWWQAYLQGCGHSRLISQ